MKHCVPGPGETTESSTQSRLQGRAGEHRQVTRQQQHSVISQTPGDIQEGLLTPVASGGERSKEAIFVAKMEEGRGNYIRIR